MTERKHGSPIFYAMLSEMADLHEAKSHDYAKDNNPFGNYHFAGLVASLFAHSPDDAGFAGRLAEKIFRLSVLEGGKLQPKNESVVDTDLDIAVIAVLWMADRRVRREKEMQIKPSNDLELYVIQNESQYDTLMLERACSYLQACIDSRRRTTSVPDPHRSENPSQTRT